MLAVADGLQHSRHIPTVIVQGRYDMVCVSLCLCLCGVFPSKPDLPSFTSLRRPRGSSIVCCPKRNSCVLAHSPGTSRISLGLRAFDTLQTFVPDAGHSANELLTEKYLVEATDAFAKA